MRNLFLLVITLFCWISFSFAQVEEGEEFMSQGTFNSFAIQIPAGIDLKVAEKQWMKMMKTYKGKTKRNKKTREIFSDNAKISALGTNTTDVYARVLGTKLTVWYDLGGSYLSSAEHPDSYYAAEKMLLDFELRLKKILVNNELDAEQKLLKKKEKELIKLQKRKEKLLSNIEMWKLKISEAETEIQNNDTSQENKKVEIDEQRGVVESVQSKLKELGGL